MVENAVIKGFDAIVLSAADSNSLAPAIKKANDANIPVILVNDTMSQAALDDVCTGGNPREATLEDIVELYHTAW
jgi:ABC-type sugar transport system substrate-binding protein